MKSIYKIMFFVSIGLVIAAIIATVLFGLRFGTDFTGGSLMEISFIDSRPEAEEVQQVLKDNFKDLGDISVGPAGEKSFILRMKEIDENVHQDILVALNSQFPNAQEDRFDSIGGIIGQELKSKSVTAVVLVLLLIVVYIGIVFRKLTGTLSPMAMGLAAIVALLHDVLIPIGVFAFLGHYYGVEITAD